MAAVSPNAGLQGIADPDDDTSDVMVDVPLSVLELMAAGKNARDGTGHTAVHWAAGHGNGPLTQHLIKHGADLEARTPLEQQTPLQLAAAAGHAGLVPLLITPTTLDAQDSKQQTALQLAVQCNRLEAAKALVAAGASLGGIDTAADTLGSAVDQMTEEGPGAPPDMALLLLDAMLAEHGAGLVREALSWPHGSLKLALHCAAEVRSQEVVVKLLEAGADRDAVDEDGFTPLYCALDWGCGQLLPLLVTPANISLAPTGYAGPLEKAASKVDMHGAVEAVLAAGAAAYICDSSGSSILAAAAESGGTRLVTLLEALQRECEKQQGPQHGRVALAELVAAAVVCHLRPDRTGSCAQLLEAVLNTLGTGRAGEVCQQVQQQLSADSTLRPSRDAVLHKYLQLAKALLSGWMNAEERLHAARQPQVTRLQRLVPGVGGAALQQQQPEQQQQQQQQQPGFYLEQLLMSATAAAAAGQEQQALDLLGQVPVLHRQLLEKLWLHEKLYAGHAHRHSDDCSTKVGWPQRYWIMGHALAAAFGTPEGEGFKRLVFSCDVAADKTSVQAEQHPLPFQHPGVYTTFLAAWVGARRKLQQLPQEVARTVVAAVAAAQQQQQAAARGGRG